MKYIILRVCLILQKIIKNYKNLMTSSITPFNKKANCSRNVNISHKVDAQSTIVKRYLNDIFKLKKNQFLLKILVHNF